MRTISVDKKMTAPRSAVWAVMADFPASGYLIVNAPNIDAAEQLLEGCPIVDSVSLYEALPT